MTLCAQRSMFVASHIWTSLIRSPGFLARIRLGALWYWGVDSGSRLIDVEHDHTKDDQRRCSKREDLSAAPMMHQRGDQRRLCTGLRNSSQHSGLECIQSFLVE